MQYIKSKTRTCRLDSQMLSACLRLALTEIPVSDASMGAIAPRKRDIKYFWNHNLPKITRLQRIQNYLARAVVKAHKSGHITPILRSLHWLKITGRIKYKLLSLTYKVLTTTQPSYLAISVYF